jgi:hypothetical protein
MVSPVKTPTSSLIVTGDPTSHFICSLRGFNTLTATELFANRLWYRTIAKIEQFLLGGTKEIPKSHPSPITRLLLEVVEIIISHFAYDLRTLIARSLTCHSWYVAAVPHLHHTLTTGDTIVPTARGTKGLWPKPLRNAYHLGLLPLVKRFRVCRDVCDGGQNTFGSE